MLTIFQRISQGLLLCILGTMSVLAQVAPAADVPPQDTPDISTQAPSMSPAIQPVPHILGWSFKDELDQESRHHEDALTLDAGHAELILFFTADNVHKGDVEYRYRLDDYDPDWTLTRNHNAHYRRLDPGHYRFEVQARLHGQPWNPQLAVLSITQKPFFYQTWYAALLVILLLVALAVQLLHQRDQLLKGQIGVVMEERNRIASDCHDTLMAGFAAISWQLETTRTMLSSNTGSLQAAAQACELARSMVTHCQAEARRIIWDLRSPEGITDLLSEGLAAALEAHRLRGSLPTSLIVEGDEVPISPGAVHHLVCICQEAITNAMHHAHASRVDIVLDYAADTISMNIVDDGRGFSTNEPNVRAGHFGISVMEERARKLGGTLRLHSTPGAGTEIAVTVHLQGEYQPLTQQAPVLPWIGV